MLLGSVRTKAARKYVSEIDPYPLPLALPGALIPYYTNLPLKNTKLSHTKFYSLEVWSQFHQLLTHTFCADILAPKITKLCFGFEIFWRQNIDKKACIKC